MTISLYLGAENINLTQPQKDAFRETLRVIGPVGHPSTAEQMHWRTRLDGDAVIMRALFNDADLTPNGLKQLLATVLAIPSSDITATTSTVTYAVMPSSLVLMSVASVNRMRFILFGGSRPTVQASNREVLAYLKAQSAAWGDS